MRQLYARPKKLPLFSNRQVIIKGVFESRSERLKDMLFVYEFYLPSNTSSPLLSVSPDFFAIKSRPKSSSPSIAP